ncbi:Ldh family oxidoreductase [Ramlibacter sp. AN1015]|uniref:Ldh family oxidoreductase n=1 Tax=Ramlibacter sp. AN1015 TaxID=3133428 RepID=UPI0030BF55C4
MPRTLTAASLESLAQSLLTAAGMPPEMAVDVASVLVEGDLLGHRTHGLRLLPTYLGEIGSGGMAVQGEPLVLRDGGAVALWDGRRLPGPWVTLRAIALASERARQFGMGAVSVRQCHHVAALAPYARRVAEGGQVLLLMSSAPAGGSVAPFGGTEALFSPSPIAAGFPAGASADPVLVDVSTSSTTNNKVAQYLRAGRRLEHAWLQDREGRPTDDPAALGAGKGTILPLGGKDNGHKGYGLSLMVEALTAGLSGHGRGDANAPWGATLFVQVLEPQAFAGVSAFNDKMEWVAEHCRANPPLEAGEPVRTPGERGLALRREQLAKGLALDEDTVAGLRSWAARLDVDASVLDA